MCADDEPFKYLADIDTNTGHIFITTMPLYDAYAQWCSETGVKKNTRDAFLSQIAKVGLIPKSNRVHVDGKPKVRKAFKFTVDELEQSFKSHLRVDTFEF